jgi:hypothetical protein
MQQSRPSLFIAPSPLGGRGVFTAEPIPAGSIIEICPVLVLPLKDRTHLDQTKLHDYYFIWGEEDNQCAIVLGFGSLYNHAYEPNAEYAPDFGSSTLDFYALQTIAAGTEITVNYSGDPSGRIELWFDEKQAK